jgi:hypothetical protein
MEYLNTSGSIIKVKNKLDILKSIRSLSYTPEKTMAQFIKSYAKRFYEIYEKKLNTTSEEAFLNDLIYYGEVIINKPQRKPATKTIAGVKKTTAKKKIGKVQTYYDRFL